MENDHMPISAAPKITKRRANPGQVVAALPREAPDSELALMLSWRDDNAPGDMIRLTIENRGHGHIRVIDPPDIRTDGPWWGLGAYDIRIAGPDGKAQSYRCSYPPLPKIPLPRPPETIVLLPGRSVGALVDIRRISAKPWDIAKGDYTITATYEPGRTHFPDLAGKLPLFGKKVTSNGVAWQNDGGMATYPKKLTNDQRQLLVRLGDAKWFIPGASGEPKEHEERRQRDFMGLLDKIKTAGVPVLARPADIEVSPSEIKNISKHDVLIVLQHETGMDVAIRTHWLTAGQTIPNRSAANEWGRVWILSPKMKQDAEQRNERDTR
jgi:hypothetical protein